MVLLDRSLMVDVLGRSSLDASEARFCCNDYARAAMKSGLQALVSSRFS
jgi:hypothetical protein